MTFANPLPWWAFIGVVACAAALAWYAYSSAPITSPRRAVLSGLRFAALFLLIVLLMRPVARQDPADPVDAVVPILIDTSRSMGIEDSNGARRIDRAHELVTRELLPSLSARFQSELLAFGEGVAPVAPEALGATARRSDLTGALQAVRERYRGRAIAGIVLISDGGETTQGPEPGDADGVAPVFAIGVGSETIDRDREVLSVTAAEAVLDDSRVDLTVSAVSHGYGTGPIEMRLLENGRPLQMQRVAPAADGTPVSATFQVSPGQGAATIYAVEIPAAAGELAPENNTRSVLVQAPARPRRVLLVQGAPGFEHSFLRRAWSGDSGLEIDSVVRKGRNEQGSDTFYIQAAAARSASLVTGYPAKTEDLFGYDAIVLANVEGGSLTTAQL